MEHLLLKSLIQNFDSQELEYFTKYRRLYSFEEENIIKDIRYFSMEDIQRTSDAYLQDYESCVELNLATLRNFAYAKHLWFNIYSDEFREAYQKQMPSEEQIQVLNNAWDLAKEILNKAGLYQDKPEIRMLTIPRERNGDYVICAHYTPTSSRITMYWEEYIEGGFEEFVGCLIHEYIHYMCDEYLSHFSCNDNTREVHGDDSIIFSLLCYRANRFANKYGVKVNQNCFNEFKLRKVFPRETRYFADARRKWETSIYKSLRKFSREIAKKYGTLKLLSDSNYNTVLKSERPFEDSLGTIREYLEDVCLNYEHIVNITDDDKQLLEKLKRSDTDICFVLYCFKYIENIEDILYESWQISNYLMDRYNNYYYRKEVI